ncbi:MAG: cysteine desulfurase family protein [Christensenellales bacterium]|jgi:cysteine desulfurase
MIYLDNSATTKPFPEVIEVMKKFMEDSFYNPAALYAPAAQNERMIRSAAAEIANSLYTKDASVYFTSGGTESNNWALYGFLSREKGRDTIITTAMEHPSILETVKQLEAEGWSIIILPVNNHGHPDVDKLRAALSPRTAVVSIMQVNNETGSMPNLQYLSSIVHENAPGAIFHSDGVQGYLRCPINLSETGVDAYSISGHKIHGPKGCGALVLRKGISIKPLLFGGGQQHNMRPGTENVPCIAGLREAVRIYTEQADAYINSLTSLRTVFLNVLSHKLENWHCNGGAAPHIISLCIQGIQGETLVHSLEQKDIFLGTGSACSSVKKKASHALLAQGVSEKDAQSTVRISLNPLLTEKDMILAAEEISLSTVYLRKFWRKGG